MCSISIGEDWHLKKSPRERIRGITSLISNSVTASMLNVEISEADANSMQTSSARQTLPTIKVVTKIQVHSEPDILRYSNNILTLPQYLTSLLVAYDISRDDDQPNICTFWILTYLPESLYYYVWRWILGPMDYGRLNVWVFWFRCFPSDVRLIVRVDLICDQIRQFWLRLNLI